MFPSHAYFTHSYVNGITHSTNSDRSNHPTISQFDKVLRILNLECPHGYTGISIWSLIAKPQSCHSKEAQGGSLEALEHMQSQS